MTDTVDYSLVAEWWATSISKIEPGIIEYRGVPVAEAIESYGLTEIIWLLLRAERPTSAQVRLLEAAFIASVDHGPHAPSIAAARMAATCGVGLNNAVATGINLLGDVHGGAGQQCMEMYADVLQLEAEGASPDDAATATVERWRSAVRYLPGFGHRFHPVDPRRDVLIAKVTRARDEGDVAGDHLRAGLCIEAALARSTGKSVPINVDGLTAIIYGELGFPAPLARGLFVLSRSIGVLAHAWEESQSGRRIKGPIPPAIRPAYHGPESSSGTAPHNTAPDD